MYTKKNHPCVIYGACTSAVFTEGGELTVCCRVCSSTRDVRCVRGYMQQLMIRMHLHTLE